MGFLLFCLKLLFFIGVGGVAFYAVLTKFILTKDDQKVESLLYSLGLGPALASLILYYSLLIIPHMHSLFYLAIILAVFVLMIAVNTRAIREFFILLKSNLFKIKVIFKRQGKLRNYIEKDNNMFILLLLLIFIVGMRNVFLLALPGHDFLVYMVQGNEHFINRSIEYTDHIYNADTGFFYAGLHGWSYPLQATLEKLVDDSFYFGYDLYFRFLTVWYGMLLLTILYYLGKRFVGNIYAVLILFLLCVAEGYLTSLLYFHIDAYRIFFFTLSIIFVLRQVENPVWNTLPLIAFLVGTSGFSHSLGIILAVIIAACLLFFMQKKWLFRIKYISAFTLLVLLFGGIHYLFDIFYGTGWIFKEIDFY